MVCMACENGAMEWWGWLLILVGAAIAVDRVMVALERRGWVRWRNTKGVGATAMGAVMGEVADAFQPGRRIIAERRLFDQVRVDGSQSGAPPRSAERPDNGAE